MASHHPAKFGGHRQCGSEDAMLLVVEGKNSTYSHLNLPSLFASKGHGMPCSHTRNFRT